MNLRFITSNCNCSKEYSRPIPGDISYYKEEYYIDNIQAFLNFKSALSKQFFSIHYRDKHINNIFIDNQSLRRIG